MNRLISGNLNIIKLFFLILVLKKWDLKKSPCISRGPVE